jgi:hypothetical protein
MNKNKNEQQNTKPATQEKNKIERGMEIFFGDFFPGNWKSRIVMASGVIVSQLSSSLGIATHWQNPLFFETWFVLLCYICAMIIFLIGDLWGFHMTKKDKVSKRHYELYFKSHIIFVIIVIVIVIIFVIGM